MGSPVELRDGQPHLAGMIILRSYIDYIQARRLMYEGGYSVSIVFQVRSPLGVNSGVWFC